MTFGTLEAVDPSINLAHTLAEYKDVLQAFPRAEEREEAVLAYHNTSKDLLETYLQDLSQNLGIRKEGILRLAGLFDLIRIDQQQLESSRLDGIPSILFGVLKATLIAGYCSCPDLAVVTAKLDYLSQRTSSIRGDEFSVAPEHVVQGLLLQLASEVVELCSKILRLGEHLQSREF